MDSPTHVALWVNLCGQFTNTSLLHLFHIIDIDMASLKKTLRTRSLSLTSSLFIKLTIEWRIITLRFIILCDINILEKTEVIWKKLTLRSFKLCSFVIFCEKTPKLFETSYPYVTSNYAHLRYFVKKKETNWNKLFIHNFNLILIWDILWKIKEVTWNKLPIRHISDGQWPTVAPTGDAVWKLSFETMLYSELRPPRVAATSCASEPPLATGCRPSNRSGLVWKLPLKTMGGNRWPPPVAATGCLVCKGP